MRLAGSGGRECRGAGPGSPSMTSRRNLRDVNTLTPDRRFLLEEQESRIEIWKAAGGRWDVVRDPANQARRTILATYTTRAEAFLHRRAARGDKDAVLAVAEACFRRGIADGLGPIACASAWVDSFRFVGVKSVDRRDLMLAAIEHLRTLAVAEISA
jgi:hypothetical protein